MFHLKHYLYVVVTANTLNLFFSEMVIFESVSSTTLTKHSYAKLSQDASRVLFFKARTCTIGCYYGRTLL